MPTSPQLGGSRSTPVGARLQFRFADGSARSNSFPKDATLRDAANWLLEQLQTERASSPPLKSLNAVRTVEQLRLELVYPRRSFAPDQLDRPLSELGLVPSAVLLVTAAARAGLRGALTGATGGGGGVVGLLVWIYTMFLSLLVFLVGPLRRLFERSPTASTSASPTSTTRASTGAAHDRSGSGGVTGGAIAGGLRQRPAPARRPAGEQEGNASVYRSIRSPSGNVRQFRPESPDDDPSATWNGNNTQQQ